MIKNEPYFPKNLICQSSKVAQSRSDFCLQKVDCVTQKTRRKASKTKGGSVFFLEKPFLLSLFVRCLKKPRACAEW